MDETKKCGRCNVIKDLSNFFRRKERAKGYSSWCKSCKGADRTRKSKEKIEQNRLRVYEYLLEHPCVDCGEDDPVVLEFDHIEEKNYDVCELIRLSASWAKIEAEIALCVVRCANCHRRKTAIEGNFPRVRFKKLEGLGLIPPKPR